MLTGKLLRVRISKNKVVPLYVTPTHPGLLGAAERLLEAYRDAVGRTRGELEEAFGDLLDEGTNQLVYQGLSKLLEDRCEFETAAELPPESVREVVFRRAALMRTDSEHPKFDRDHVLNQSAQELGATTEQIETALFADLHAEQRILKFQDMTPSQLLHRYNVALIQAILLRCVKMEIRVFGETPARFRQLFRAIKFHRLIATITPADGNSYRIALDGPLSLFQSTNKYGLQLAMFLPTLLHCKTFDLNAELLWGIEKKPRDFELSGAEGLKTHLADFGVHTPREIEVLMANIRATAVDWVLSSEPEPLLLDGVSWIPDFKLIHTPTGKEVFVEVLGFWRKLSIVDHYKRLKRSIPGRFVLVISEQNRVDETEKFTLGEGVVWYKRTPLAAEVLRGAAGKK